MSPERPTADDATTQTRNSPAIAREQVAGCIEVLDQTRVAGWALRRGRPETPVEVEVRLEDRVLQRTRADRFRQDLVRAGIGDGRHGFNVVFDTPLRPEQKSGVSVLVVCGADGPYVPLVSRAEKPKGQPSKEGPTGNPQAAEAGLPAVPQAVSELRNTMEQRLAGMESNIRSALTQFAAETKLAAQSMETKCLELRSAQDSLGRFISAMEVCQARLDAAVSSLQDGPAKAASAGKAGRGLAIFVAVLALISTASLVLGLISVFG